MTSDGPKIEPTPSPAGDAESPLDAEMVIGSDDRRTDDPQSAGPPDDPALPQPNLIVAAALTTVPLIAQTVVGFALMLVAMVAYLLVTARPLGLQGFMQSFQIYLFPVGTLTTLLVAVVVCRLFFKRELGRRIGWRGVSGGQLICVIALTIPMAVLASELTNWVSDLLLAFEADWIEQFRESSGELFQQFAAMPWWFVFIGGCLLPGLGEEIYCRGLLSRGLVARYGVVAGTLAAAGLFGAMHIEPVQAIGAFALGVGMQYVFLTTRSLAAPIVLHTLNNSFAFLTMRYAEAYPIPGLTPLPDGGVSHTPLTVMLAAVAAAAALSAVLYENRTRWQLPDGSNWSLGYVSAEMPPAEMDAVAVRGSPRPLLILAAVFMLGLFVASLVAAHLSVAG